MVELLAAAAGAVGPRFGPVVRVRAAGLRGRLLQPALTRQREREHCRGCLARLVRHLPRRRKHAELLMQRQPVQLLPLLGNLPPGQPEDFITVDPRG
jgi:hypothetical protein